MLISKRSRKTETDDSRFRSRFRDAEVNFPLRQYMRCRDAFAQRIIHSVILTGIVVALMLFGRTLHHLFERHGMHLNPWYERFCLLALALVCLVILRRIWGHLGSLPELRRDMREYNRQIHDPRD